MFTIKSICTKTGLSHVYVHRMIMKGVLKSTKVLIGNNTYRHEISEEDFNSWRESTHTHSRREDGRNRYILYSNPDELEKLQELLKEHGIGVVIERNRSPKPTSDNE